MLTSPDFKDLLKIFKRHKIRYLIVGGYAVMKYSEPRFTKDLDVFIASDRENAKNVFSALKEFGAPMENLTPDDFAHEHLRDNLPYWKQEDTDIVIAGKAIKDTNDLL
jgi:hypothetical protein